LVLLDSTSGIRVGIGGSYVLQVASAVCSNPAALASMVLGVNIATNAWMFQSLLHSPVATNATVHRLILALMTAGTLAGTLAVTAFAMMLLKTINDSESL
jgi:hypothetical protein